MHSKHLSLSAAVLAGSLALSLPAVAQQQAQQQSQNQSQQAQQPSAQDPIVSTQVGPGVRVGADIVDAVEDLREATGDLAGRMVEAREGFSVSGWNDMELRLQTIQQELQQMEQQLSRSARTTDEDWQTWMSGGDYNTRVAEQVRKVGDYLSEMATMVETLKENQTGVPIVVGEELVDQVDEVREAVAEMVAALQEAGPQFGWPADDQRLNQAEQKLQSMEEELARKANEADQAWATFIASPEFRTTITGNIQQLAQIVKGLFSSDS